MDVLRLDPAGRMLARVGQLPVGRDVELQFSLPLFLRIVAQASSLRPAPEILTA